jgi:predicted nucleic acid-binding protein
MPPKTFIDSNVLIYAHDKGAGIKQQKAIQALNELWLGDCGVLSVQILQEFYSTVTRKLKLARPAAQEIATIYFEWCGGETTFLEIQTAFRMEEEARISFWDSLMLATAVKFGATRVLTEGFDHGQIISGVEIVNPFRTS